MSTTTATLQWSERKPPVEVLTGEELDEFLDRIAAACPPDTPISVRLQAHGFEADILLGLPESFVYLEELSSHRYFTTVGDSHVDGLVAFYMLGQHHTEFYRRNLIPTDTARRALREFFDTGRLPTCVEWEEGQY